MNNRLPYATFCTRCNILIRYSDPNKIILGCKTCSAPLELYKIYTMEEQHEDFLNNVVLEAEQILGMSDPGQTRD